MRTLFGGPLWLSYSQAYVTSGGEDPHLDTSFCGQSNGLLGAALGDSLYLTTGLHTGTVPLTVELHDAEPPAGPVWEEIVEASFCPLDGPVLIMGCCGSSHDELALAPASYRARYCARGMDAGRAADTRGVEEPEIDRYLLQLWPAPPAPDRIVRQTSEIAAYWHGVARSRPTAAEMTARRQEQDRQQAAAREREQEQAQQKWQDVLERQLWGGPKPDPPLGDITAAAAVAQIDRPIAEELAALPVGRYREVARWAARAALAEAGIDGVEWVVAGRDALDAGHGLPAPFDIPGGPLSLLLADPRVPSRTVTTPDGRTDNLSQQAMGLCALIFAADPDPAQALFVAVQHAQLTFGRHRLPVLHAALRAYLRTL